MRNDKDDNDDKQDDLRKLQKRSNNAEVKRNKDSFDRLMSFNNENKKYFGLKK
ncbi:MAG: hypothetical protein JEZ08_11645 [Clostridiales bacterium]|nr:hypothetical protein [Clostridiales bacterium]